MSFQELYELFTEPFKESLRTLPGNLLRTEMMTVCKKRFVRA